jgi:hypothetical protein
VTDPRSGRTVQLDPSDPGDRLIIDRQVAAARQAGRDGGDRTRTTVGRADLERAYDEGAAEGVTSPARPRPATKKSSGGRGRSGSRPRRTVGRRLGSGAANYLSRGSWRPTLRPPTRARDAGGLLAGMLLYTGVVTYLRYGPAGWKGWLSAKFLNKPMPGVPASGIDPDTTTTGRTPGIGAT